MREACSIAREKRPKTLSSPPVVTSDADGSCAALGTGIIEEINVYDKMNEDAMASKLGS